MEQYINHITNRNYSKATINIYKKAISDFLEIIKVKSLSEITVKHIDKYINYLSQKKVSAKTMNLYLIAVRNLLSFSGIPLPIKLAKVKDTVIPLITDLQFEKVCAKASSLRDRAIVELLFATGVRVHELVAFNKSSIPTLKTENIIPLIGKGGKLRAVFISDRARVHVEEYLATRNDENEALFINKVTKKRLSIRSVQKILEKLGAMNGFKLTPHMIRHYFATDILNNGAGLRSLQELLGHSSIITTMKYTHMTNSFLQEEYNKYHNKR